MSLARLPIRVRRTRGEEGEVAVDLSVLCPIKGLSVALGICQGCERCERVGLDAIGCEAQVLCHVPRELLPGGDEVDPRVLPALGERTRIADVMTSLVTCVRPELPVVELTRMLIDNGWSGVPVVDDQGVPIGVVSKTDLLRQPPADDTPRTAADVMTAIAFTLPESAPLAQGAAMMAFERVHRVPVVDDSGAVVGILSALDVMDWMARQSGYLTGAR